jgi:hypothetical protein
VLDHGSLQQVDLQGRLTEGPLLDPSTRPDSSLRPVRLAAGGTSDDVWLEAREAEETLLFRTRAMTNMLWCDYF